MYKEAILEYSKFGLIFINRFFSKISSKSILFIPHGNCKNDGYDIINCKSDNVLCLFNEILRDKEFNNYKLNVLYYDRKKLDEYLNYCKPYCLDRITFIHVEDILLYSKVFVKSSIIFTDEMYRDHYFKSKKQKIVCLNYYPFPYKSDYSKLVDSKGNSTYLKEQKKINKFYDYLVSTSDMASIMITQAVPFYFERCVTLGYPRSDVFYQDNTLLRDKILSLLPVKSNKIITYVPTHRDYENPYRKQYDSQKALKRTIWGYVSEDEVNELELELEKHNAIIIAKIHPIQARSVLADNKHSRIITYADIVNKTPISLNELMAISDAMITDYTSAVFDFLNVDKPIIYYHYDIEKYNKSRGFVINPMEPLCAGAFAYSISELITAIADVAKGVDDYSEKRKFLLDFVVTYKDAESAKRVKEYFLK